MMERAILESLYRLTATDEQPWSSHIKERIGFLEAVIREFSIMLRSIQTVIPHSDDETPEDRENRLGKYKENLSKFSQIAGPVYAVNPDLDFHPYELESEEKQHYSLPKALRIEQSTNSLLRILSDDFVPSVHPTDVLYNLYPLLFFYRLIQPFIDHGKSPGLFTLMSRVDFVMFKILRATYLSMSNMHDWVESKDKSDWGVQAGINSGISRRSDRKERNERIAEVESELIEKGQSWERVSILAKRFNISERQIRNILKKNNKVKISETN